MTDPAGRVRTYYDVGEALAADCEARPGDAVPLLLLADWLSDQGRLDDECCCRWMAARGAHPHHREKHASGRAIDHRFVWAWYAPGHRDYRLWPEAQCPAHAVLPKALLAAMAPVKLWKGYSYYPSWGEAVADLGRGLEALREVVTP